MSVTTLLPDRPLERAEIEALRSNDQIEQLEIVTERRRKITAFTVELNIKCYALHCDPETRQWETLESGDDFAGTVATHRELENKRQPITID